MTELVPLQGRPGIHPDDLISNFTIDFNFNSDIDVQYHILINSSLTALGVCTPDSVISAVMRSGGV